VKKAHEQNELDTFEEAVSEMEDLNNHP
jgi:hypothetical protein